jgi:hypothetical protein
LLDFTIRSGSGGVTDVTGLQLLAFGSQPLAFTPQLPSGLEYGASNRENATMTKTCKSTKGSS